LWETATVT
jgi:hypothetical protein